jgi:2-aminoadipate transaminase
VILKQGADLHTSTLNQMMAAEFVGSDAFAAHVARIIEVYRDRRDAMVRALEREMPAAVRFTRPAGGLFLWVELPPGIDARLLLRRCLSHGVAFVPGAAFHPCGGGDNTLRLNFSNMPPARIEEGIRRLAAAVRELAAAGTAAAA